MNLLQPHSINVVQHDPGPLGVAQVVQRQGQERPAAGSEIVAKLVERIHETRDVRLLGDGDVLVDVMETSVRAGDLFLLCSDGLTTMLSDSQILGHLTAVRGLEAAARDLVRHANEQGGVDNVTVVLLEVAWRPAEVMGAYPWALHATALATARGSGIQPVQGQDDRCDRRDGGQ